MRRIFSVLVILGMVCFPWKAPATIGRPPVTSESVQGEWVCLEPETRLVYRLRVAGTDSIFVITQGPGSGELVLFGRNLKVRNGQVSVKMSERAAGGVALILKGEGNALGPGGTLHLLMEPARGHERQWTKAEVVFLKDTGPVSVIDDLVRSFRRAKELLAEQSTKPENGSEPADTRHLPAK